MGGWGALLLFAADLIKMSALVPRDHPDTKDRDCVEATGGHAGTNNLVNLLQKQTL